MSSSGAGKGSQRFPEGSDKCVYCELNECTCLWKKPADQSLESALESANINFEELDEQQYEVLMMYGFIPPAALDSPQALARAAEAEAAEAAGKNRQQGKNSTSLACVSTNWTSGSNRIEKSELLAGSAVR